MTDILEEVLSDQSEEKRLQYFKKLLPVIIVCAIVVAIIMIINNWQQAKDVKNNQRTGDILVKSLEIMDSNQDLALESLEHLISTSHNHAGELAALIQIGIKLSNHDYKKAKTLLEAIINNTEYSDITAAYARLSWLNLNMDEEDPSERDKEITQQYFSYFSDDRKVFFGTVNLLCALWDVKNLRINDAKTTLSHILALNSVPSSIKEQAKTLMAKLEQM